MFESKRTKILVVGFLVGVSVAGFLGVYLGYFYAVVAYRKDLRAARQKIDTLEQKLKEQNNFVKVAEMTTHAVISFSGAGGVDITPSEAQLLVDQVKEQGKVNEVVEHQFAAPLDAINSTFEKDLENAPSGVNTWRGLALHWQDKYEDLQR